MSPDMKRLVVAADKALAVKLRLGEVSDECLEVIVRAVLTELREVSERTAVEIGLAVGQMDVGYEGCEAIGRQAVDYMIDAILAEPTAPR